jgi:peptidoglycan/LPS O-acetylase OafA/YrhL
MAPLTDEAKAKVAYGRENNFDVIRLVAAWSVIITHGFKMRGLPTSGDPLSVASGGWLILSDWAVYTFFIISGYLITASAARAQSWQAFARNRFLRIWPGLAVCVAFCAWVLGPALTHLPQAAYWKDPSTWWYLQNASIFRLEMYLPGVFDKQPFPAVNGSLWTLQHEVLCYGLVGLLLITGLVKNMRVVGALAVVWFGAYLHYLFFGYSDKIRYALLYTNTQTDDFVRLAGYFIAGMVAYLAVQRGFRFRPWMGLAAIGWLVLTWWMVPLGWVPDTGWWVIIHPKMPHSYFMLPIVTFALAFAPAPEWLRHPLGRGRDWSYGIYIYGMPVQQLVMALGGGGLPFWVYQAVCLVAVIPFAAASWHWIEGPALRLKGGQKSAL